MQSVFVEPWQKGTFFWQKNNTKIGCVEGPIILTGFEKEVSTLKNEDFARICWSLGPSLASGRDRVASRIKDDSTLACGWGDVSLCKLHSMIHLFNNLGAQISLTLHIFFAHLLDCVPAKIHWQGHPRQHGDTQPRCAGGTSSCLDGFSSVWGTDKDCGNTHRRSASCYPTGIGDVILVWNNSRWSLREIDSPVCCWRIWGTQEWLSIDWYFWFLVCIWECSWIVVLRNINPECCWVFLRIQFKILS